MTITTVKRTGLPAPRAMVAAVALAMVAPASQASWKFSPQVEVRETYTDNLTLQPEDRAQAQWVTELAPGFALDYNGPRLDLHASYAKRLYSYSDKNTVGQHGNQQELQADAKARLIDELLFVDASAGISQQVISAFGPVLVNNSASGLASGATSEVKTYKVSPYLLHRFGSAAQGELRYIRDQVQSGTSGFANSDSNTLLLNLASGPAYYTFGWGLQYSRQEQQNKTTTGTAGSVPAHSINDNLMANLRYQYSSQLTLGVNGGYERYDYEVLGGKSQGNSWTFNVKWVPSARTSVQASAGKRYFGNSYSLAAVHRARNTVWNVLYSDAVTTSRAQFMQSSTVNTAALLDQMLQATIPDPVARRQAVEAYIAGAGLPPSLVNNINYLSNRYMLQKQLQANGAFNWPRSTLVMTLFDTRRSGLSSVDVDAGLLGASNSRLNDDTHVTGASASWNWRLSSRTSVALTTGYVDSRSLSVGRSVQTRSARLGVSRQLQARLRGSLELRRSKGGAVATGGGYTENVVSASLSKQF